MKDLSQSINIVLLKKDQVNLALEGLVGEAESLFRTIDVTSVQICTVEEKLNEIEAHFPFKYILPDGKPSEGEACISKICWHLSWERDENSKNFRLFLISTEARFKRPFIETNLSMRFQFIGYLVAFISNFQVYLREYRLSIESGKMNPIECGSFDLQKGKS